MFTFAFGVRITWKPVLPWKPKFKYWFSLFWIHFLIRITTKELIEVVVKEVIREPVYKARDPQKEKSLAPDGSKEPHPIQIKKPAIKMKPVVAGNTTKARPVVGGHLYHEFYGSQLIVDKTKVVFGLSQKIHTLELTPSNQVFIDNNPYKFNPTDVQRIRTELIKSQKK